MMLDREPDDRSHVSEAAALALLLSHPKQRYSLQAMIGQAKIRPRPFRQIRPTISLKSDMAAPHFDIVKAWAAQTDPLMRAYATGDHGVVQQQGDSAAAYVALTVAASQRRFPGIVQRLEQWHRGQWNSRIRASTGLDVSLLSGPSDVASDMDATTVWNQQLAEDVHQQTRARVVTALLVGLAAAAPAEEVNAKIAEAVGKARKRAAGIGDDQVDKASRGMDRSRRVAAGLTAYRWHHTPQRHPRDWHKARDGKRFAEDDIDAGDRAGVPPFCKCWEEPLFD